MFPDSSYEEGAVQLDPGDLVITYTDGIIEAANESGGEWGVQGLLNATAAWARQGTETAAHLVQSIFTSMDDFSKECLTDDATFSSFAGALVLLYFSCPPQGVMAITRRGLPEPPTIFSGAAMTMAPVGGS
jgi:hypothetical protein